MSQRFKGGDKVIFTSTFWEGQVGTVIEVMSRTYCPYLIAVAGAILCGDDDCLQLYNEVEMSKDTIAVINIPPQPETLNIPIPTSSFLSDEAAKTLFDFPSQKSGKWKCQFLGDSRTGMSYTPVEGGEPNWFHRLMQRLILGHKWSKVQ